MLRDADLEIGGVSELLEELAAVAAGGGGDGEGEEAGDAGGGEVGDEELLGVDRVVEGDAGELEVDAEEDPAVGSQPGGADVVVGDWRASQGLGRPDQGREELNEREA